MKMITREMEAAEACLADSWSARIEFRGDQTAYTTMVRFDRMEKIEMLKAVYAWHIANKDMAIYEVKTYRKHRLCVYFVPAGKKIFLFWDKEESDLMIQYG